MTDNIKSITELATAAGVSWKTAKAWTGRKGFPKSTPDGWDRGAVLSFARDALARAAKCQTGPDQDLKRRKLELQCKILETELARKRGELAVESSGTVPRDAFVEELHQITLATWASMDAYIQTMGNTTFRDNTAGYTALCNLATDFLQRIKRNVKRRLTDSPLKLTAAEIDEAVTYSGGNQW